MAVFHRRTVALLSLVVRVAVSGLKAGLVTLPVRPVSGVPSVGVRGRPTARSSR